jgi:hypothetical protein
MDYLFRMYRQAATASRIHSRRSPTTAIALFMTSQSARLPPAIRRTGRQSAIHNRYLCTNTRLRIFFNE